MTTQVASLFHKSGDTMIMLERGWSKIQRKKKKQNCELTAEISWLYITSLANMSHLSTLLTLNFMCYGKLCE